MGRRWHYHRHQRGDHRPGQRRGLRGAGAHPLHAGGFQHRRVQRLRNRREHARRGPRRGHRGQADLRRRQDHRDLGPDHGGAAGLVIRRPLPPEGQQHLGGPARPHQRDHGRDGSHHRRNFPRIHRRPAGPGRNHPRHADRPRNLVCQRIRGHGQQRQVRRVPPERRHQEHGIPGPSPPFRQRGHGGNALCRHQAHGVESAHPRHDTVLNGDHTPGQP